MKRFAQVKFTGRATPAPGAIYTTVSRFPGLPSEPLWSIVLKVLSEPDASGMVRAEIEFLSPDAPHERLSPGQSFGLHEGGRLMVRGHVE
jgi:hypothetical protein